MLVDSILYFRCDTWFFLMMYLLQNGGLTSTTIEHMQSSASSNNNNFAQQTGDNRLGTSSVQALKSGMSSVFNGLSEVNNSVEPLNGGTNEKFTTETDDAYDSLYERSDMIPPHPSSASTSSAYMPRSPSPSQENQPLLSRR